MLMVGGTSWLSVFDLSLLIVLVNRLLINQFKNWHVSACRNCNSSVDVPNFKEIFDTFLTNVKLVKIEIFHVVLFSYWLSIGYLNLYLFRQSRS